MALRGNRACETSTCHEAAIENRAVQRDEAEAASLACRSQPYGAARAESIELFLALMRRACPDLSVAELDWRVNCIIGAQVFSQMYSERVGKFFGGAADVDESRAVEWMLHFILHGVNAPPQARK